MVSAQLPSDFLIRFLCCCAFLVLVVRSVDGAVAFEKLTDMDYRGSTYYTIRNLTLYECQGWCREEPECQAASFSFVPKLGGSGQETVCLLQNGTTANNPAALPAKAVSTYYMVKLRIRSEKVCERPWTFERLPNHMIQGLDNALIFTSTKEACLAACLNEDRFVCRSAEYNYVTLQCHMSEYDRRSTDRTISVVQVQGVDYFENLCLTGKDACKGERVFSAPQLGVPSDLVNRYIETHFYVDLELMANNAEACRRACEIESEILCRSYVYRGPPTGTSYNCQLFHMDHVSIPDGRDAFRSKDRPLYDPQVQPGAYYENSCRGTRTFSDSIAQAPGLVVPPSPISTKIGADLSSQEPQEVLPPAVFGNFDPGTGSGSLGSLPNLASSTDASKYQGARPPSVGSTDNYQKPETTDNANCDSTGTCYDVSVQCKDTRIVVQLATNRPFNGRVYALGRSETCNVDVFNSDRFRLDLTLSGQDCNTQTIGTVYSNTVVVQHHSVVMTKTDKIYKVRCTYDMSSKNITFGMLPIRDPEMISITSAPAAPAPRIRILDQSGQEVETVRIGDRLTFRIDIPDNTPYGIFARNCIAMAKDARSTFHIVDADGCPSDPAIFPGFKSYVSALESQYEAFRFTESYGVIFQCNVKYCLGECDPANCEHNANPFKSWGRRRRSVLPATSQAAADATDSVDPESMTLSQEILVLDFGDEPVQHSDRRTSRPSVQTPDYYSKDSTDFNSEQVDTLGTKTSLVNDRCPSKLSVLALSAACAVMVLSYICGIFYLLMKRWMIRNNKVL